MPRALLVVALAVSIAGCGEQGASAPPYFDLAGLEVSVPVSTDLTMVDSGGGGVGDGGADLLETNCARIVINSPVAGSMLIGVISVDVEISSGVGIVENSVAVTLGGANGAMGGLPVKVTRKPGGNHFVGTVNVRGLSGDFIFPVLSVSVDDKMGRHCTGESPEYKVDFVGPAIDLDPPKINQVLQQMGKVSCSHSFDPVGDRAANDGEAILQLSTLRARVEDRYSAAPGQTVGYYSLLKAGSVKLYLLPQPAPGQPVEPLVVATGPDRICDDINPKVIPKQGGMGVATEVGLGPIPTTGGANFLPFLARGALGSDSTCNLLGLDTGDMMAMTPPVRLCGDLTIHLGYTASRMEPAIYSIPPFPAPPAPGCSGTQFDAANSMLPEGPLCAAVVAWDNAGNRSVSRPIHLCYDKGNGKCDAYSHRDNFGRIIPPVAPAPYPDCGVGPDPLQCQPGVRLNIVNPQTGDYRGDPFPNAYEVYN